MAQNRKASEEERRAEMLDAIASVVERLQHAEEARQLAPKSLKAIRAVQVARDELAAVYRELKQFDDDRDAEAVRRQDANPRRNRSSWPVGAPSQTPAKSKASRPFKPEKPKPALPPPVARPAALGRRTVVTKELDLNGHGTHEVTERLNWWCGADRATLAAGAAMVAKVPPGRTASAPASKAALKSIRQQKADAKRDELREKLAGELQQRLKPHAGDFSTVPPAE